jgi:sialic acid synthase SpsE
MHQKFYKIPALETTMNYQTDVMNRYDADRTFVSFNQKWVCRYNGSSFKKSCALMATDYNVLSDEVDLSLFQNLKKLSTAYGISDHSIDSLDHIYRAIDEHGITIVEKHFTLEKNMSDGGAFFRDTAHGLTPLEFEEMTRTANMIYQN